jgi:hypothetical protein
MPRSNNYFRNIGISENRRKRITIYTPKDPKNGNEEWMRFCQKKGGGGSDVHFISYTNTFQLFIKKNNYMKQYVDSIPFI